MEGKVIRDVIILTSTKPKRQEPPIGKAIKNTYRKLLLKIDSANHAPTKSHLTKKKGGSATCAPVHGV